jgi:signal transduction histidine kinase
MLPSGSGLGLSIVRAIIERHGGTISASNGPNGGARFEMWFPAAEKLHV